MRERNRKRKRTAQTTLDDFFNVSIVAHPNKKAKIDHQIDSAVTSQQPSKVVIPLRPDGAGRGSFFDHRAIQLLTNDHDTVMLHEEDKPRNKFLEHLRTVTVDLRGPVDNGLDRQVPAHITPNELALEHNGLLIIPGVSRRIYESPENALRQQRIHKIIGNAIRMGQPILAICGGTWDLWEFFGGKLKPVNGHSYRGGMPRMNESTGKIGHNKMLHRIKICRNTLLAAAMTPHKGAKLPSYPPVNSVHWLTIDINQEPDICQNLFEKAAISVHDENLVPKKKDTREPVSIAEHCIEGFSSRFGAPIIATQFHPEAFSNASPAEQHPELHKALILYMIKAGDTFKAKKAVLNQIKSQAEAHSNIKKILKPTTADECTRAKLRLFNFKRGSMPHLFGAKLIKEDQHNMLSLVTIPPSKFIKSKKTERIYTHLSEIHRFLIWQSEFLHKRATLAGPGPGLYNG